jgi:nucleoside-diphosphate-sugar epimerase
MTSVLLAGGAGFIGSHIADRLLAEGATVVAVDNLCTGRRSNVAHLDGHPRFSLLEHDITQPLPAQLESVPFDAVLHLASPASPDDFARMPLEILETGSTGTRRLLDLAVAHQARFFLASTSEVYGDPLVHPQPESYLGNVSSIGPRSCYDEAKRFSEALTMAYHRVHGIEVRIVRIFNTYGERMRPQDGRVVNNFVVQALRGEPLTLHGDGSQTRSFCHVADEVEGLLAVLEGVLTGPVNVGNPGEFSMRQLAELVSELTGSPSEIVTVPLPPEREGDPLQRQPDISLARATYGWSPTISLRDGLRRMIDHFIAEEQITPAGAAGRG